MNGKVIKTDTPEQVEETLKNLDKLIERSKKLLLDSPFF